MQLSNNFTLEELTKSTTAIRKGIDNTPSPEVIKNLKDLCTSILQPIRDRFGPIKILSGYRSPQLNAEVGGSKTSDHMEGLAADIECNSLSNYELACWIRDSLVYEQVILEFYTSGDPYSGWVHVSFGSKKQALTAIKENGKTIYKIGLVV